MTTRIRKPNPKRVRLLTIELPTSEMRLLRKLAHVHRVSVGTEFKRSILAYLETNPS